MSMRWRSRMGRSSAARVASRAGPTRGGRSLTSCATIPMKTPPRVPDSLADRVTRLEVLMESLGHQIARELDLASKIHTDLATLIERHDTRLDSIEKTMARALGVVAVLVILANILSPVIQRFLGIPM